MADKYIVQPLADKGLGKMRFGVWIHDGGEGIGITGKITDSALVACAESEELAERIAAMLNDGG